MREHDSWDSWLPYQAHCGNVRCADVWLLWRDLNSTLEWVPRDYKEIRLFGRSEGISEQQQKQQYLPAKKYPDLFLRFSESHIYYI